MAASMIRTRTVFCAPNTLNAAPFFSSSLFKNVKVAGARRRICALQDGVWKRFIRSGGSEIDHVAAAAAAAGSARIRQRKEERGQGNRVLVRAERGGRGDDSNRDEDGIIKDMELYLDDLSLEYESVWDTKPAWCQPWSIVTTGLALIGGSWLSFQNIFVTGGASFVIGVWWFSFLYAYPLAYTEMIAERRKNVKSGSEDTFGTRRVQ